jgi:hypothetical protein
MIRTPTLDPMCVNEAHSWCSGNEEVFMNTLRPVNARRLLDAMERLEAGGSSEHDLIPVD